MTVLNTAWPGGKTYYRRSVLTQGNAGATNCTIDYSPGKGNEFIVMSYRLLATVAAAKTCTMQVLDADGSQALVLASASLTTGQYIEGPKLGVLSNNASSTANATGDLGPSWPFLISGTESLRFSGASLAQNDTVTAEVRFRVMDGIPQTITVGAAGVTEGTVTGGIVI